MIKNELSNQLVSQLNIKFECKKANENTIPELQSTIKKTEEAAKNENLSIKAFQGVVEDSTKSMKEAKNFSLKIHTLQPNKPPETLNNMKVLVNQLNSRMTLLQESKGFQNATGQVKNEKTMNEMEKVMDEYDDEAEQTLGVYNLKEYENASEELENLKNDSSLTENKVEIAFQKANAASTVYTGVEKATNGLLDDSRLQGENAFQNRLRNRAKKSKQKLNAVTLDIEKTQNKKLKTIIKTNKKVKEDIAKIKADNLETKKLEENRQKKWKVLVGENIIKLGFINFAQEIYDNPQVNTDVRNGLQETLATSLELWANPDDNIPGHTIEKRLSKIASHAFSIISLWKYVLDEEKKVYSSAIGKIQAQQKENAIEEVTKKQNEYLTAVVAFKDRVITHSWAPYINYMAKAFKQNGGESVIERFNQEYTKNTEKQQEVEKIKLEYENLRAQKN